MANYEVIEKIDEKEFFLNNLIEIIIVIFPVFLSLSFLWANDFILDTLEMKFLWIFSSIIYIIIAILYFIKFLKLPIKECLKYTLIGILIFIYLLCWIITAIINFKWYEKYIHCKDKNTNLNFSEIYNKENNLDKLKKELEDIEKEVKNIEKEKIPYDKRNKISNKELEIKNKYSEIEKEKIHLEYCSNFKFE